MIGQLEIRHPHVGEVPSDLMQGLEVFKIDPEWQWVVVHEGEIKAQMLCANAHGLLIMMRLTAHPDAPFGWALALFRKVLKDAKQRGILGYGAFLSDKNEREIRLMPIVQRSGGVLVADAGVWAFGSVEVNY